MHRHRRSAVPPALVGAGPANIVKVALEAPLKQIAINAGLEGGVYLIMRALLSGRGSAVEWALSGFSAGSRPR